MNNPLRILETLDRFLTEPAELTLFGRSALALGYSQVPQSCLGTQDVDGILPTAWLAPTESHEDFWQALQQANLELEPDGLYITHLFREIDVILQPDWLVRRVQLDLALIKLTVFRPATIDLILTKMARGDDEDLEDIRFLLAQESFTTGQLTTAFGRARVPDIPEIQELFDGTIPKVLILAEAGKT